MFRPRQQAVGDDPHLDFGGTLENLGQPRIAPVALEREILGIAVAAVDLQRLAGDALGHFGGKQLRHRGFLVTSAVRIYFISDEVRQLSRRLDLGRHLRDFEPNRLEITDRMTEGDATLRIVD